MVTQGHIRGLCLGLRVVRAFLLLAVPALVGVIRATAPKPPVLVVTKLDTVPAETLEQPKIHDLTWYAPLWQRDLKQPPIPRAVEEQPAAPQPDPGPLPALVATLIEPNARFAHLRDRSGKAQLKGVGDSIDGFRVKAIEPGRVQLQDGDRLMWVQIPKRKKRQ